MAGFLKVTVEVQRNVLWCEAGHITDACPCLASGHGGLGCGPRPHGPLPTGLKIVEGDREIGKAGEWMMLVPRLYTVCAELADGTHSPLCKVELPDQEWLERTVIFT